MLNGVQAHQIELLVGVILVGSFVQSMAGFGFALFSVPLMSMFILPKMVVVISLLVNSAINVLTTYRNHSEIRWREVKLLSTSAVLSMPLGVIVLLWVAPRDIRFTMGVSTIVASAMLMSRRNITATPEQGSPISAITAGALSGVLSTSLSTDGPPLVVYLRARQLSQSAFRSTISVVFLISSTVALVMLSTAGAVHRVSVVYALIAILPLTVGWFFGNYVAERIGHHHFALVVDIILFTVGVMAIINSLT